jgi:hypothetical protein
VFVVSLKASDSFSAFLFKDIAFTVTGGAFDTGLAGLRTGGKDGQKNVAGLSHLSIFTLAPPPTPEPERVPAPVPLPAAVWLLAIGVGGLLLAGRRRAA